MYANFCAMQGARLTRVPLGLAKVSSIMKIADISLAVFTLYGLSAGVFWLSVRGSRSVTAKTGPIGTIPRTDRGARDHIKV
jgi:hypothetical protein